MSDGNGWNIGEALHVSVLHSLLHAVRSLLYIERLYLHVVKIENGIRTEWDPARMDEVIHGIVVNGSHSDYGYTCAEMNVNERSLQLKPSCKEGEIICCQGCPWTTAPMRKSSSNRRRLIPKRVPEWTDENAHDPGITFIELFAWLTEMQRYFIGRVPDKNRRRFLDLLGITPADASSRESGRSIHECE